MTTSIASSLILPPSSPVLCGRTTPIHDARDTASGSGDLPCPRVSITRPWGMSVTAAAAAVEGRLVPENQQGDADRGGAMTAEPRDLAAPSLVQGTTDLAAPPTSQAQSAAGGQRAAATDLRNSVVLMVFTAVTNLADGVTKIVLPLLAIRLTQSPLQVTGVALTLTLPWLLTALHIGAIVDRLDRRRLIVAANGMRVTAVTALLFAVQVGAASIPLLYAAGLVLGVAEVIALTAATALVPMAVSPPGRDRVNSWMTAAETVCNDFCGPFVGGMLVAVGYAFALGSSASAFLATLLIPLLLVGSFRPARRASAAARPMRAEIVEGMRFLWRSPLLRTMALTLTVLCLCWGAWLGLIPLLATRAAHVGPTGYGLIISGLGGGGVSGAVSALRLLSWGALPIGSGVVGALAEVVGLRAAFLPFVVGAAALVVPFFRVITPQAVAAAEGGLT